MLKLSTKTTYAVRALIDLARSSTGTPVRLSQIADRQNIPLPFLEQIFSKLKNAHVVSAIRGPQGGYQLAQQAANITLGDLVSILEGPIEPVLCTHPENRSEVCHEVEGCMSRKICSEIDGAVMNILNRNTLETMCNEADQLKQAPIQFNYQQTNS